MKDIVIIGAGPAGLTAGIELLRRSKNCRVTILEKSKAPGGISRTETYNGNFIDIGGHRYFTQNNRVRQWWLELLPLEGCIGNSHCKDNVMLTRPRFSHIFYNGHLISYPIKINKELFTALGGIASAQICLSYLKAVFFKRTETSLEDYYVNRFGRHLYALFFKDYTIKVCGASPSAISPDWGRQRVKGLSIAEVLRNILSQNKTSNGTATLTLTDSFLFPPHGAGQLWKEAASQFQKLGGRILYDCQIEKLLTLNHKICGIDCSIAKNSRHIPADILISTMPLKELFEMLPNVPLNILEISNALSYRDFITVGLLYDKEKLGGISYAEKTLLTDTWVYIQEPDVSISRMQIYNNWSPEMVASPEQFLWLGLEFCCTCRDSLWQKSDWMIFQQSLFELKKIGILSDIEPTDYCVIREKNAYPGYYGSYFQLETLYKYLFDHYDNLHCLGRNGEHKYLNMDQVMECAFDRVEAILNAL